MHHGRDPKYIDKNHAGTLIIWDRLFGTFQQEEERPTYGITKPIQSWNPVWANISHYASMAEDLKRIPAWKDKIKYLFKKPGWLPEHLGGYRAAPAVEKSTYQKYETPAPLLLNYYVLFQYLICLGCTSFFLFKQSQFPMEEKISVALLMSLWVVNSGVLFENRKWVWYSEWGRIVVYPGMLVLATHFFNLTPVFYGVAAVYFFVSSIWFHRITSHGQLQAT